MTREEIEAVLEALVEKLAAIEHERWSDWQRYVHEKGEKRPDGSLLLPSEQVQHWDILMATDYSNLSESSKESDREQVRRYLPVIAAALTDRLH
jgi:hypothetical protein